jgi:tetratricopeptide (TPR) repeat protein
MAKHGRSSAARAAKRTSPPTGSAAEPAASDERLPGPQPTAVRAAELLSATPPPGLPSPEAVGVFQAGMEALQGHRYADAAVAFTTLVTRFPTERALLDRARVYLDLCERELRRLRSQPTTPEERLTAATAALNDGDEARAEGFVQAVLAEQPEQDLALYLSAAIHARRGRRDEALAGLRQVIALRPDVAAQATLDPDFDSLHDSAAFHALTTPTAALPRRARRMRH